MKIKNVMLSVCVLFLSALGVFAQGVGISTTGAAPDPSAILDVAATNKGVLFPRMTTVQRDSINPVAGLLIYNTDINCYQYFNDSSWVDLCAEQKTKDLLLPRSQFFAPINSMRSMYGDEYFLVNIVSNTDFYVYLENEVIQKRSILSDWASASQILSAVRLSDNLYLLARFGNNGGDPVQYRVYKYNIYNINAGGTLMTISGLSLGTVLYTDFVMTSDGTDFYFNHNSGSSANDYVITRYSLTGSSTLTYQSTITCGSTTGLFNFIPYIGGGYIYGYKASGGASVFSKFSLSTGTLVTQYGAPSGLDAFFCWEDALYASYASSRESYQRFWLE